jgi:hypothetical protein
MIADLLEVKLAAIELTLAVKFNTDISSFCV